MENYVNLNRENTLKLYHYCTEIADALRVFLNTPGFYDNAEPEYWIPKLTEFKAVIDSILTKEVEHDQ